MHIPDHMLSSQVSSVSAITSVVAVAGAIYFAVTSKDKPNVLKFAAISSLIFALQMMNFPIQNGTSGHFLGTTFAIGLLRVPFGILSMVMVLTVQCLVFADGGLTMLGANILNMAIVGAIPGIIINFMLKNKDVFNTKIKHFGLLFLGSWLSIVLASFVCSIELGISGMVGLNKAIPAMVSVHSIIGVFEGIITISLFFILSDTKIKESNKLSFIVPVISAMIIALILSPFASGFPDGLEWVAEKLAFLHESAPLFVSPLSDYTLPIIKNQVLTTGVAGFIGVVITFLVVLLIGKIVSLKKESSN
ncbi:MAG TPA: energy-coupling factor ABC transporter permease [Spirochaetota bacterium]|nr:energy-coupling factor ABC transporter permease [Spirochaetota bacterium]